MLANSMQNGSALIYSTYIGGGGTDYGSDIAIYLSGEVYITGSTRSLNYPITAGAFQSINAGNADIFVTKLSSTGSSLIYSTFLGGHLLMLVRKLSSILWEMLMLLVTPAPWISI
ncbi:MAG: SBBP repeat-containing protein [Bacteroidetes bacterium]|nr:SBBP repeat-containing protein [Bacteroidota bacterium]